MYMKIQIADTIKQFRQNKNLTQEDIASALGVSFQAVSRWENGLSYPDIELLPQLAALLDVTIDVLFGMDAKSEEIKIEQYKKEDNSLCDTKEKIVLTNRYIKLLPSNVYLKQRLLELYVAFGLEFAKSKLPEMRSICQFVIDHTQENNWMRHNALRKIILVEDEENLDKWLSQLDRKSKFTSEEALLQRYDYRGEIDKYNKGIQKNLYDSLKNLFLRDFCKRDKICYKNAESRMLGQQIILNIMDILSDTTVKIDAWIEDRIFAYLRLAAGCFGCSKKEDGYVALEKCVCLCEEYKKVADGTILYFNTPSMDMICQPADSKDFINNVIYHGLTTISGWEWFNCVREDEKYKKLVDKIEALIVKE